MANSTAICNSFKTEILTATHNFTQTTGHVFKAALFTSAASLGAATTAYGATNEISGTGYTAGGFAWTAAQNTTPTLSGSTAVVTWTVNPSWTTASFTANAALIYNSSASDKAVSAHAFGGDQTVTAGTFTLTLPTADASNAIIRIA